MTLYRLIFTAKKEDSSCFQLIIFVSCRNHPGAELWLVQSAVGLLGIILNSFCIMVFFDGRKHMVSSINMLTRYRVSQKKPVKQEISISFELMILYKDYICLDTCKHMKDTCQTLGNSLDPFSAPKKNNLTPHTPLSGHLIKSYANFLIHRPHWVGRVKQSSARYQNCSTL